MRTLLYWFIRNPVAANLLMLVILVAGVLSLWNIRIEGFPKIPPDTITITIDGPGISAVDIDRSITQPVERQLDSLRGVRSVSSLSLDDQAIVSVRKTSDTELRRLLDDIKVRMDSLPTLPTSAERPVIEAADPSYAAMILQVYGDVGQKELQRSARVIKRRLLAHQEISEISQWGERPLELSVELEPSVLRNFDLTLSDIADAIGRGSSIQRDGELDTPGGTIQIRTDQRSRDVREFSAIPIAQGETGAIVTLGDIATVREVYGHRDVQVRFRGQPAIGFEVAVDSKGNLLQTNRAVQEVIEASDDVLSDSIRTDVWANQTDFVVERLETLQQSAWQGLLLVFVILACFLSLRLAFWVAVGIPICLAGTLAVMTSSGFGYSLNDITTFGMIIVLGILVDDAVVVGESVFTSQAQHADPIIGTGQGVERVATATVFGVLTTMAAFLPMTTFQDPLGKVFGSFAVIVIIALAFSLIESKFILPSHLVPRHDPTTRRSTEATRRSWHEVLPAFFSGLLLAFSHRVYRPVLKNVLSYRWPMLILFCAIAYAVYGMVSIGAIRSVFFPAIPGSVISVEMEFDARMRQEAALESTERLARMADELNADLVKRHGLEVPPISTLMTAVIGPTDAQVHAELSAAEDRPIDALQIAEHWRRRIGDPEGIVKLEFQASEETSDGFELEIYATDRERLDAALNAAIGGLRRIEGVSDVRSNFNAGQASLSIKVSEVGLALGLDADSLTRQISHAYAGVEVQRHQQDNDEVRVYVRYPGDQRNSLSDLLKDYVRLPDGQWVPLSSVATIDSRYVPSWLWRKDGRLGASVSAHVDKSLVSSPAVFDQLMAEGLRSRFGNQDDIDIVPAGEIAQEDEVSQSLWKALILACLLIYGLLAVPLRSYVQPLIILSVVPFGFVGAALGHFYLGIPFSVLSFFGMLALSGIVVNDSLILVTRFNDEVASGTDNPIVAAAQSRFRAVFLTTLTTVAGLTPILMQTSEQAQYLIPAAVSLVFGELFATMITLILVPVFLAIGYPDQVPKRQWSTALPGGI